MKGSSAFDSSLVAAGGSVAFPRRSFWKMTAGVSAGGILGSGLLAAQMASVSA
jgi:hypothetical protein